MGSKWTVKPEQTEPIDLAYTDDAGERLAFWVRLKKRLTVGESRKVMTAGWKGVRDVGAGGGSEVQIDWQSQGFARAEMWLTDWSLEDDERRKLPLTREVIEALSPGVFKLIEDAITAHIAAVDQEKKATPGPSEPAATSI